MLALPNFFKTDLFVSGVPATDLFTFNTTLGATIESQVVEALNSLRSIWDPNQRYAPYLFVRQAQRFPDVILRSPLGAPLSVLLGIELKGWYVLAKEREPSFRYKVTPAVCAPADLLVVFPWVLSHIISGSPRLFQPYVTSAQYAALYRNWHWQYQKADRGSGGVKLSNMTTLYPVKGDTISDDAVSDKGKNFGRFARTGLMDTYIHDLLQEQVSGIPLGAWQRFFKIFSEDQTSEMIARELDRMATGYAQSQSSLPLEAVQAIKTRLEEIVELLKG